MDGLLTPVSTAYKTNVPEEDALIEVVNPSPGKSKSAVKIHHVSTPEDALAILRSEPNFDGLRKVLQYISPKAATTSTFDIRRPSAVGGQIVNTLVTDIVPNYWHTLSARPSGSRKRFSHDVERSLLLSCLRTLMGLSAILLRLKVLIQEQKDGKKPNEKAVNSQGRLEVYLEVLTAGLEPDCIIRILWADVAQESRPMQKTLWRESVNLIAGGKLLNAAAEARRLADASSSTILNSEWISEGLGYCRWLGRSIREWACYENPFSSDAQQAIGEMIGKSMRLGYPGIFSSLLTLTQ